MARRDPGVTGYNVPLKFLVDVEVQQEGVSIGALLVLVVVYVVQLGDFADYVNENDPFGSGDLGRGDLIGFGVWVGAAAWLVVGGLLSGRRDRGALPSTPDRADERSP